MMMKMLDAGGLEPLTDNRRKADEDNPEGYYEYERVKKLTYDKDWLPLAKGKAVKIVSALLKHLPSDYSYKVIFLHRNMDEILASQKQMLVRKGEPTDRVSDEDLARLYKKHLRTVEQWLDKQPNFEILYLKYNEVLQSPIKYSKKINKFLDNTLDYQKMPSIIDSSLYRQRGEPSHSA
jgi:hypothetical protein